MSNLFSPPSTTFSFIVPLMETCSHVIDPDGDVVLTLKNPSTRFAIWEGSSTPTPNQHDQAPTTLTFRASSRHLKLASPVFKAALNGVWVEGTVATKGACQQMDASEWDAEAFRIVLSIIHGRNDQVPRDIPLEMLCKIAVIVDYYQCDEVFRFCSSVWISSLRGSFTKKYDRTLILWLCVSWVFRDEDIFEAATKAATEQSDRTVGNLGLPIPERVIDQINKQRKGVFTALKASLHNLKRELITGTKACSFDCRASFLGLIIMCMDKHKLLEEIRPSYECISVATLTKGVRALDCGHSYNLYCCFTKLKNEVEKSVDKAMRCIYSLKLKDYTHMEEDL